MKLNEKFRKLCEDLFSHFFPQNRLLKSFAHHHSINKKNLIISLYFSTLERRIDKNTNTAQERPHETMTTVEAERRDTPPQTHVM